MDEIICAYCGEPITTEYSLRTPDGYICWHCAEDWIKENKVWTDEIDLRPEDSSTGE